MKKILEPVLVTGGAGFIGSHLVERLLSENYETHVLDNLSKGSSDYIKNWEKKYNNFKFFNVNLLDESALDFLSEYQTIYHFAANPEVRLSTTNPDIHFKQNVVAMFNVLEAIKNQKIKKFVFLSTSAVYGDATKIPTSENYAPLDPISPYAACKLASEALIGSYAHTFNFNAIILRLANIIGEKSTHGIIFDFIKKLKKDPSKLEVLGDGTQSKSYLYISDCINAIQIGLEKNSKPVEIFNVGSDDQTDVMSIAKLLIKEMNLDNVDINCTGGTDGGRGWTGDVKNMHLDISRIKSLGWKPQYTSSKAVKKTIKALLNKD